jgi:two-component system, chemotaxis family, chemotaxis protein CheY
MPRARRRKKAGGRMKLLIVDDSRAMRLIVKRTLRQAGMVEGDMSEAENGKQALDAIRASKPDLIFSDWNMPEMSGIELLETLKREGPDVPFVFVTSESAPDMLARAVSAGARSMITKPFSPESFKETLTRLGVG